MSTHTKSALRRRLRAARRAIPDAERALAHERMAAHLGGLVAALPGGSTVALYAGLPDEADARGLLPSLEPGEVAWPRVHGPELELVRCAPADLVPGFRGVPEPPSDRPPLALTELGMVIVPGLGFDHEGHRLGQGGGHYDRLLARLRADAPGCLVVGLAYAVQIVPRLPRETHDEAVDVVVTELGAARVRGSMLDEPPPNE